MKTSKIVIKNLFGIRETTLDGKSVEISGPKGAGKTSVLDAIRFALTNRSERDCIVHQGADEGEIIIETTTGLSIDRKALPAKSAGTVKVRDGSLLQTRPAEFLSQIFTPLQLNPVEFTQLSRQEKNRVILSLIEFDWDVNWIREQFGEIPQGVDYSKHILEVLNDIQAENGVYFQSRQNINRDIRNKQAFISDIAKDIPSGYDYDRWNQYPIGDRYRELERLREKNSVIERAKAFRANFTSKLRGLEGSRDVEIGAIDRDIAAERAALTGSIERMKAELQAAEEKLAQLSHRRQDRVDIATAKYEAAKAKLEKDVGVAEQYADQEPVDTTALAAEVTNAEEMRKHLNEYQRMVAMQAEVQDLTDQSAELTRKIELARELPATILAEAHIPVEGLTVENGIPLINGLPISNLSDGELLELCVDISVCKPGQLEIILIDGAERLDKESRERLYAKCKAKLAQGVGRTRGNRAGGVDLTPTWRNCILTTGESPLTGTASGAGAVNRVIDIECKSSQAVIKDGMRISNSVKRNFGFVGRKFVDQLYQPGVVDQVSERYRELFRTLSDRDTTEKQAMAAASIILADELACQWIFSGTQQPLTIEQISEFLASKAAVSAGDRGYKYLCDWVTQNSNKLCGRSENPNIDVLGALEPGRAYIIRSVFERILQDAGYSTAAMISYLKQESLIETRGRANTKGKRINGIPTECFCLRLPTVELDDEEDPDELPL